MLHTQHQPNATGGEGEDSRHSISLSLPRLDGDQEGRTREELALDVLELSHIRVRAPRTRREVGGEGREEGERVGRRDEGKGSRRGGVEDASESVELRDASVRSRSEEHLDRYVPCPRRSCRLLRTCRTRCRGTGREVSARSLLCSCARDGPRRSSCPVHTVVSAIQNLRASRRRLTTRTSIGSDSCMLSNIA